jgi:hypothetical protein
VELRVRQLGKRAFTSVSWFNTYEQCPTNLGDFNRLEKLGDAVLDFLVSVVLPVKVTLVVMLQSHSCGCHLCFCDCSRIFIG